MIYDLICRASGNALIEEVNKRFEAGWEALGAPFIAEVEEGPCFIQAMIKSSSKQFDMVNVSNSKTSDLHQRIGARMGRQLADCISDPVRHKIPISSDVVELPNLIKGSGRRFN